MIKAAYLLAVALYVWLPSCVIGVALLTLALWTFQAFWRRLR